MSYYTFYFDWLVFICPMFDVQEFIMNIYSYSQSTMYKLNYTYFLYLLQRVKEKGTVEALIFFLQYPQLGITDAHLQPKDR